MKAADRLRGLAQDDGLALCRYAAAGGNLCNLRNLRLLPFGRSAAGGNLR
jgi:hypothetical protein